MINSRFKKISAWVSLTSLSLLICVLMSFPGGTQSSNIKQAKPVTILNEAWQKVNENFFDPKFNGVDWKAMQAKYEPLAKQAKSIEEVSPVINQMLSELNTSHTRFYTKSEPAYYQLLGIFDRGGSFSQQIAKVLPNGKSEYTDIGIFTKLVDGKTFISGIIDGSPAAKAGLNVGDRIIGVDGSEYQPIKSFANKAGKEVQISIQRSSDPNSIKKITAIPKNLNPTTMFVDAMQDSIRIIDRDRKKIGYIHIWSYAGDQYQQQLVREITYGKLRNADALILDLRDGWGGADPNYLNIFTDKVPVLTQTYRDGRSTKLDWQWRKPVVMLVNNGTRSGKEILAYGFKKYNIGKVIGTKTAGAVVGGSPFFLQDGNLLYLAVVDVLVDGERLEGKGVIPDIEVPFTLEYAEGKDPQLDTAVNVLASAVTTNTK